MPDRSGELRFEVHARHILQLGRELVADKVTAVSELIKNAYDADATRVSVVFRVRDEEGSMLVIEDDGEGMDLDDIRTKWMRISTPYKDTHMRSELYDRRRAGKKGIGRFSVETLGRRLELVSSKRGSPELLRMTFDWSDYGNRDDTIESITNPYSIEDVDANWHGTRLTIRDLRGEWTGKDLRSVRRAVLLLQPPFPVAEIADSEVDEPIDPGFRVEIESDIPDDQGIEPLEELRDAATAVIEGEVTTYGRIERRLISARFGLSLASQPDDRALHAGPFSFRAYYFVWKSEALGDLGSITQKQAQNLANEFGGIRLYRDGLRILPYGEKKNDWLGLDALYRQRTVLPPVAKNNFFGEVHITREDNPSLIDTASREGVVESPAFHDMREVVRDALVWGAREIAAVRSKKQKAKRRKPPSRSELVEELLSASQDLADAIEEGDEEEGRRAFESAATKVLRRAARSDREEERDREQLIDELNLLRVLASLGASMAVFSHEVRSVITTATSAVDDVASMDDAVPDDARKGFLERVERATSAIAGLQDLSEYIDQYVSRSRRRDRKPLPVAEVVRDFVERFTYVFSRAGVNVEHDIDPRHLRTIPMARSELDAILFNLVTNSMKALDTEGISEKRILIRGRESQHGQVVLSVLDTGKGIDAEVRDRIFQPFVTTAPESSLPELGVGTGLGLKIVTDIAQAYGGLARIGEAPEDFQTCVQVVLPAEEASSA